MAGVFNLLSNNRFIQPMWTAATQWYSGPRTQGANNIDKTRADVAQGLHTGMIIGLAIVGHCVAQKAMAAGWTKAAYLTYGVVAYSNPYSLLAIGVAAMGLWGLNRLATAVAVRQLAAFATQNVAKGVGWIAAATWLSADVKFTDKDGKDHGGGGYKKIRETVVPKLSAWLPAFNWTTKRMEAVSAWLAEKFVQAPAPRP